MDARPVVLEDTRGRIRLRMTALRLGQDLSVTLSGGDRPHIGAVALAQPEAEPSTLVLPKHREEPLAHIIASTLATRFRISVCAACGIHLEAILPTEIQDVLEMTVGLTQKLGEHLKAADSVSGGRSCPE